ncbi:hypothetical protein BsWGS_04525 [Bradybaena similaris]
MSKSCVTTENGHLRQFSCSLSQHCCGGQCCDTDLRFYTHWYFWLAVSVLVLFLIGAIISAYCKHRHRPPYKVLHLRPRHDSAGFVPWMWGLEKDSCQSSSQEFHHVHTARPFLFPYNDHRSSLNSALVHKMDANTVN